MRLRSALPPAVALVLLLGGCNQILGIEPGILDTGDGGVDGSADALADGGRDAPVVVQDGPQGDALADAAAQNDGPRCADQCGTTNCGDCPSVAMLPGDQYQIDPTEVTNQAYAAFLATRPDPGFQATRCLWNITFEPYPPIPSGKETHPVVGVDWCDAYAYCTWARKRLCGKVQGASLPITDYATIQSQWYSACKPTVGNFPYGSLYGQHICNGEDHAVGTTVPAGSMTGCVGSLLGLYDMSGNVAEWEDSCDGDNSSTNLCRVRGGSFLSSQTWLRCDADATKTRASQDLAVGFRCCRD